MNVRRTKPYIDVNFTDHARLQATKDLDAAAGAWLRCLAQPKLEAALVARFEALRDAGALRRMR